MKPVIIISAIVILVFIFLIFLFNFCDEECFLEKANNCEPYEFTKSFENITILIETFPNCSISKKIISLDVDESIEIKELFLDKLMVCSYERENFPVSLLYSLSSELDYCEGELKDNILIVLSLIE